MRSESQSNRAQGPRAALTSCPATLPAAAIWALFRPAAAAENPASRRFRAPRPARARRGLLSPDACRRKLRAGGRLRVRYRELLRERSDKTQRLARAARDPPQK